MDQLKLTPEKLMESINELILSRRDKFEDEESAVVKRLDKNQVTHLLEVINKQIKSEKNKQIKKDLFIEQFNYQKKIIPDTCVWDYIFTILFQEGIVKKIDIESFTF